LAIINTTQCFKIVKAIESLGFGSLGISEKNLSSEGLIIQLGCPPLRLDLLTSIDGVKFEECYPNRKTTEIDGLLINFISYDDLIKNKKASGRHQDLGDIENLQND